MIVRQLVPGDEARAYVFARTFLERSPTRYTVAAWLADSRHLLVGAFLHGAPAGWAYGYHLPRPDGAPDKLLLYTIDVAEPWRRLGIGTRLLAEARRLSPGGVWVVTNASNEAAMSLYRRAGGERPHGDDVLWRFAHAAASPPA